MSLMDEWDERLVRVARGVPFIQWYRLEKLLDMAHSDEARNLIRLEMIGKELCERRKASPDSAGSGLPGRYRDWE